MMKAQIQKFISNEVIWNSNKQNLWHRFLFFCKEENFSSHVLLLLLLCNPIETIYSEEDWGWQLKIVCLREPHTHEWRKRRRKSKREMSVEKGKWLSERDPSLAPPVTDVGGQHNELDIFLHHHHLLSRPGF